MNKFKIYKESPGIISEGHCWVCLHDCYMYTGDTFIKLILEIITQFKSDKNLVG